MAEVASTCFGFSAWKSFALHLASFLSGLLRTRILCDSWCLKLVILSNTVCKPWTSGSDCWIFLDCDPRARAICIRFCHLVDQKFSGELFRVLQPGYYFTKISVPHWLTQFGARWHPQKFHPSCWVIVHLIKLIWSAHRNHFNESSRIHRLTLLLELFRSLMSIFIALIHCFLVDCMETYSMKLNIIDHWQFILIYDWSAFVFTV